MRVVIRKQVRRAMWHYSIYSQERPVVERLENFIRMRAIQEMLTRQEVELLRTLIMPERSFEENIRRINDQIEAIKVTRPRPPPAVPEIPVFLRRVRTPQRIPEVCRSIEEFRTLELAKSSALARKRQDPRGIYGYAYNPDTGLWASINCSTVPARAEFDREGLLILLPVERVE